MTIFTNEFIKSQMEIMDKLDPNCDLVGTDEYNVVASYGYDDETDSYDYGLFAQCGDPITAEIVYNACKYYRRSLLQLQEKKESEEK